MEDFPRSVFAFSLEHQLVWNVSCFGLERREAWGRGKMSRASYMT